MGRRLLLLTEEVRDMKKDLQDMQVGDTFFFGDYHGGIEWRVLEKTPDSLLVISKYALDCKRFDKDGKTNDWNSCSLKRWLSSNFFNKAFDSEEKSLIENTPYGKIFLLSREEGWKLFSSNSDRQCKPTQYAKNQGAWVRNGGNCEWWLRSQGYDDDHAVYVDYYGDIFFKGCYVKFANAAVRPAMRLVINFV